LFATIVLFSRMLWVVKRPPALGAVFPLIVTLARVAEPRFSSPPP
jgi:hypothetical protein